MAGKNPDVRLLIAPTGGASASGESAQRIRSDLQKAFSHGLQIQFKVDPKSLTTIKKELEKVVASIKVNATPNVKSGTNSKQNAVSASEYKGATVSTRAMSQATKELTDAKLKANAALDKERIAREKATSAAKIAAEQSKANTALVKEQEAVRRAGIAVLEDQGKAETRLSKIREQANNKSTSFSRLTGKLDPDTYRQYEKQIQNVLSLYEKASTGTGDEIGKYLRKANEEASKLGKSFQEIVESAKKLKEATRQSQIADSVQANAQSQIASFNQYLQTLNPKALTEHATQINEVLSHFKDATQSTGDAAQEAFVKGTNAAKTMKAQMKELGYEGGNAFTYLHGKLQTFIIYLASSAITMGLASGIRDAISAVYDLDEALTDLRMVTDGSKADAQELLNTYNQMGRTLGATTQEVAASAIDWQRQGYSLQDTNTLIEASMVLSKVGMIDSAEATQFLTSMLLGYKLEAKDAMSIVDMLTAVDLEAAVSAGGLAEAFARTANSARLAGVDMQTLMGYMAATGEVSQRSMDTVGEAFKRMFSRYSSVKLGKLMDDEGESINDFEKALDNIGVKLRHQSGELKGNFREFNDVLAEVVEKYNQIGDKAATDPVWSAIPQALGGTVGRENVFIFLENYANAMQYAETATNSAGTAMQKFGAYQESVGASQNRLTASFEKFSQSMISSGFIILIKNIGATLLDIGAGIPDVVKSITILMATVTALTGAFNMLKQSSLGSTIAGTFQPLLTFFKNLPEVISAATTGVLSFSEALQYLNINPVFLTITAVAGLGYAAYKIFDAINVTAAEQKVKVQELTSEYNAAMSEIEAVESELDAINGQIREIEKLSPLSMTDESELTRLRQTNQELETSINLMKTKRDDDRKTLDANILLEYEKDMLQPGEHTSYYHTGWGNARAISEEEYAKESIRRIGELNQQKAEGIALSEREQALYDDLRQELTEIGLKYSDWASQYSVNDETRRGWVELSEIIDNAVNPEVRYQKTEKKNAGIVQSYLSLRDASSGTNTDNEENIEKAFRAVSNAANEAGLSVSDFIVRYQGVAEQAQGDDVVDIAGALAGARNAQDAYKSVMSDLDSAGTISLGTLNSLVDEYPHLSDAIAAYAADSSDATDILDGLNDEFETHADILQYTGDITSESFSSLANSLEKVKQAQDMYASIQEDIANGGEITLETLQDLASTYPDLEDAITKYNAGQMTNADITALVAQKYQDAAEAAKYYKNILSTVVKTTDELIDSVQSSLKTLQSAHEEYAELGEISVDTLQELIRLGPEYIDLLVDENGKISLNSDAVAALISEKTAYLKTLAAEQVAAYAVSSLNALMAKSTDNAGSSASSAKAGLQEAAEGMIDVAATGIAASTAVDMLDGSLRNLANEEGAVGIDMDAWMADVKAYAAKLASAVNSAGSSIKGWVGGGSSRGSGGSDVDAYIAQIDELYEVTKKLSDVQYEIEMLEARTRYLDDSNYSQRIKNTEQLLALKEKENILLHEQSQMRREMIRDNIAELEKQGLEIEYDPAQNNFLIKNLEKINELKGKNQKETNELIKKTEDLIKTTESLNDANAKSSLAWYSNAEAAKEYKKQLMEIRQSQTDTALSILTHQNSILEHMGGREEDIVLNYERMMDKVVELAAEYRSRGYEYESEEVRKLEALWWQYYSGIKQIRESQVNEQKQGLEDVKKNLESIVDLTRDLVKQEQKAMVDTLKDGINRYREIIELKKKSLELTKQERSYADSVNDKNKDIHKLQVQIDELSLDSSRGAQAKRASLLEELAEKQKELSNLQFDRSVEKQQDALDEELEAFENTQNVKIKEIERFLDNSGALTEAAMKRIDQQGDALYSDLLDYALQYTRTSEQELLSMWDSAKNAVNEYGSALQALSGINSQIESLSSTPSVGMTFAGHWGSTPAGGHGDIKAMVSQMKTNSVAWWSANNEEKKRLSEENRKMGSSVGATIDSAGIWWLNGQKLYDIYHAGTPTAGQMPTPKQNELWALLEKGEAVLTQGQQDGLMNILTSLAANLNVTAGGSLRDTRLSGMGTGAPINITVSSPLTVASGTSEDVMDSLKKHGDTIADLVFNRMNKALSIRGGRINPQLGAI